MQELNDEALMIARGKLSTLRREWHRQRKTAAEKATAISSLSAQANRDLNDGDCAGAKLCLECVVNESVAMRSLCDSIDALQAEMKLLQPIAWPTGRIDE